MKIYGDLGSGNCLKVKYTADHLGMNYEWVPVNIMKGEARTTEFAALNPAMQTPTVDFGGGKVLAQSNAIIRYLARGQRSYPTMRGRKRRSTNGCSGNNIATSQTSRRAAFTCIRTTLANRKRRAIRGK